jgi:FkbM family methyltransferase
VVPIDESICILINKRLQRAMVYPYASKAEFNRTQMLISHIGTFEHLWRKYSYEGFSLMPGDTVIDVGSFIGSFAVSAVQNGADRVIAVEPAPANQRCLRANVSIHLTQPDRVEVLAAAVSNFDGVGQINLSSTGADNSLLEPDEGSLKESVEVELVTLKRIFELHDVDPVKTFLKVEAEGAEVEALEGLGDLRPHKIVVDVSPERDGEEPREQIASILKDMGYCIVGHSQQCLFARARLNQTGKDQ